MTDEELIARLRWKAGAYAKEAADRIEALVKERDEALEWLSASQGYIADAVFALDKQEKAEARAERLEAALQETTQVLRQCTFPYIRVKGQYLDREEVVSRADAALKGDDHD